MPQSTEHWLPVVGHEDRYEVSDHGRVRSLDRVTHMVRMGTPIARRYLGVMMNPSLVKGHLEVRLHPGDQTVVRRYVHHLVLEAFVGRCPEGLECCHDDDDGTNNHLGNLRWDTQSANMYDRVRNGRHHARQKVRCKRDHLLQAPNLIPSTLEKEYRNCLACSKGYGVVRHAATRGRVLDMMEECDKQYLRLLREAQIDPRDSKWSKL